MAIATCLTDESHGRDLELALNIIVGSVDELSFLL